MVVKGSLGIKSVHDIPDFLLEFLGNSIHIIQVGNDPWRYQNYQLYLFHRLRPLSKHISNKRNLDQAGDTCYILFLLIPYQPANHNGLAMFYSQRGVNRPLKKGGVLLARHLHFLFQLTDLL